MKQYDPKQVTIAFGPFDLTAGLAQDEFIRATRVTKRFESAAGADGEVIRTKSNDGRWMVSLNLLQTSSANDLLAAQAAIDENTEGGGPSLPLTIRDRSGRLLWVAAEAWLTTDPDHARGTSNINVAWEFECDKVNPFPGGN